MYKQLPCKVTLLYTILLNETCIFRLKISFQYFIIKFQFFLYLPILQVQSIDEFSDNTMTRIFTTITDWHFAKGFDASYARLGKVCTQ